MRSSTSSSKSYQDSGERTLPSRRLGGIVLLAALLFVSAVGCWELEMRREGLTTADIGDGRAFWAVERRKVDQGPPDPVVVVGDSRILFDTDLDTWQRLTGHRPIQLALPGQNAQPVLHDLASNERFRGLVIMGTAEMSYFANDANSVPKALKYMVTESPSQRAGHEIYVLLSHCFAFLDSDYTMFALLEQRRWPERKGVSGPYDGVWKISESLTDRQTYLWGQLTKNPYLREHARQVWLKIFAGAPPRKEEIDSVIARSRADIVRIRARGGEVVWVRPPSTGPLFASEQIRFPRRLVWDRLVRETDSFGIYFLDYPSIKPLALPDWSHLNRAGVPTFTDAYVSAIVERVPWLRVHDLAAKAIGPISRGVPCCAPLLLAKQDP